MTMILVKKYTIIVKKSPSKISLVYLFFRKQSALHTPMWYVNVEIR